MFLQYYFFEKYSNTVFQASGFFFFFHLYLKAVVIYLFFGHSAACGILVPQLGIEPMAPELEVQNPNQ